MFKLLLEEKCSDVNILKEGKFPHISTQAHNPTHTHIHTWEYMID